VRFLLDEHVSPRVAAGLRELGHDAVAVAERADLAGSSDDAIMRFATDEVRVLVSRDIRDVAILAARRVAVGAGHAGIVLLSPRRFVPSHDGTGRLVEALDRLAAAAPVGLADRVVWLEPRSSE
jgi:hypothetical protein